MGREIITLIKVTDQDPEKSNIGCSLKYLDDSFDCCSYYCIERALLC